MLPKRRFWKDEQKMKCGFSKHFSTVRGPNWVLTSLKSARKSVFHLLFILPKSSFRMGRFQQTHHHDITTVWFRQTRPVKIVDCPHTRPKPFNTAWCNALYFNTDWYKVYPSQTKILEGGTKDEIRISKEALFKGVSTRFGPRAIEKSVEHLDFIFCSSFQNLRLGSIKLLQRCASVDLERNIIVISSSGGFDLHIIMISPSYDFDSCENRRLSPTRDLRPLTRLRALKFTPPKRRFWKAEPTNRPERVFEALFNDS